MNQAKGQLGEEAASKYLQNLGYHIVARNYRCPEGEIDIICTYQKELVFVEVKTRPSTSFGFPEEAVTRKKQNTIRKASRHFLADYPERYHEIRFDVISILLESDQMVFNHIKAAF